jgi:outer membrane protein assembly factor BamA
MVRPERWVYIPPSRSIEGNILKRLFVTTFITPVVFFNDEVGFGGGVSMVDLDFRNQGRREFVGTSYTYTTEGQQNWGGFWRRKTAHVSLGNRAAFQESRNEIGVTLRHTRTLTRRFFGIGPDQRESDEATYTDDITLGGLTWSRALPRPDSNLLLRTGLRYEHRNLSQGRAEDLPQVEGVYSALFKHGDGYDGGWATLGISYDTRDSSRAAYRGGYLSGQVDYAPWQSLDKDGARFSVETGITFTLPPLLHSGGDDQEEHPPTDSLAFGLQLQWAAGEMPYYHLPYLGGSDGLRGFPTHRWRDRAAALAGVEYRFWFLPRGFHITRRIFVERLGLALFYETGTVAPSVEDLEDVDLKQTFGISLRASFEREALLRIGLGFSEEGANIVAGFGATF